MKLRTPKGSLCCFISKAWAESSLFMRQSQDIPLQQTVILIITILAWLLISIGLLSYIHEF
jgi:hypothetical protein